MNRNDRKDNVAGAGTIIRFIPNFSVFVQPPNLVCLYAEDRQFLLHGALYCAVASAIGTGKELGEIIHALSSDFSRREIDDALHRLAERRFIVAANERDAATAGYWASLGLLPDKADANLEKHPVRIQALGNEGASELNAALRELGVRIVDCSADLTVVLVNDYLDERLAEFNRERLAQRQSWLPVQLSGIFPLVGPIFSPGKGACWTCLAQRLKWNRQIKAFLDRHAVRCVAASPLAARIIGQGPIGLAAVEIARTIASDFQTNLHEELVSLDLLGSAVVRHDVTPRPQCPSCGRMELRDPQRTPMPIRLHAGGTFIATRDGYRALTPAATVARYRKHVSPLTGVVSRLERTASDLPATVSFRAAYNFSPSPEMVAELKAPSMAASYGKGSTAEQAEASALMEGIERYCGVFQGDEIRTVRKFADFSPDEAILPNDVMLFSDAQYHEGPDAPAAPEVPRPFDPSAEIEWSPVWSPRDERFKYLPTGILYYFHEGAGDAQLVADSNGCAAGNTFEEAIVQGFLELVERDACAIWWYNRLRRAGIDLGQFGDNYIDDVRSGLAAAGRETWALDITTDLKIPVVVAVCHWRDQSNERITFGAGAYFEPRIAAVRAFADLNTRMATTAGMTPRSAEQSGHDGTNPLPLRDHAYVRPHGKAATEVARSAKFARMDRREQVRACVALAKRHGLDFLVLDQTRPDIEAPVARVIVPGLRHHHRRFAPGRLYEVPVGLGLRKRPIQESELNPLPFPI